MKIRFLALALAFAGAGCASYPKVELKDEDFRNKPLAITLNVPFEKQTPKLCGPTALYMVAKPLRPDLELSEVTALSFTNAANGSYKQDMLAAARRLGLAPYLVQDFQGILGELASEKPVVIFHRTKFLWKDYWHYSVVTGYDKFREELVLHIGPYRNHEAKVSDVVGSWMEGGSWAFAVYRPTELPPKATAAEAIDNALAFLRLGNVEAAFLLSQSILKRWSERYEADVILAEAWMKKRDERKALLALKRALKKEPQNLVLKQKVQELSSSI